MRNGAPPISAGREIWKGLFLTYAREFSSDPLNELLAEYELSQYLRLRASGSDASGARARNSLFRRVERFGVDVNVLMFCAYAFRLWRHYSDALARKTFRFSILYLSLLFAALLVDHYVHVPLP